MCQQPSHGDGETRNTAKLDEDQKVEKDTRGNLRTSISCEIPSNSGTFDTSKESVSNYVGRLGETRDSQ